MDLIDYIVMFDTFIILIMVICWPDERRLEYKIEDLEKKIKDLNKKIDYSDSNLIDNDGHYY